MLETKEVSGALAEAGINAKQLASAVEEGRGSAHVDSATADTQVGSLVSHMHSLAWHSLFCGYWPRFGLHGRHAMFGRL